MTEFSDESEYRYPFCGGQPMSPRLRGQLRMPEATAVYNLGGIVCYCVWDVLDFLGHKSEDRFNRSDAQQGRVRELLEPWLERHDAVFHFGSNAVDFVADTYGKAAEVARRQGKTKVVVWASAETVSAAPFFKQGQ